VGRRGRRRGCNERSWRWSGSSQRGRRGRGSGSRRRSGCGRRRCGRWGWRGGRRLSWCGSGRRSWRRSRRRSRCRSRRRSRCRSCRRSWCRSRRRSRGRGRRRSRRRSHSRGWRGGDLQGDLADLPINDQLWLLVSRIHVQHASDTPVRVSPESRLSYTIAVLVVKKNRWCAWGRQPATRRLGPRPWVPSVLTCRTGLRK